MTAWPCDADPTGRVEPELRGRRHHAQPRHGGAGRRRQRSACSPRRRRNVVVDVSAWYGAGDNRAASVVPSRIADTRTAKQKLAAGQVLVVKPTAAPDVPATGVHAVALNVTATEPEKAGYLTVYPCDQPQPVASNVNYTAGHDTADAAIVGGVGRRTARCASSARPPPTSSSTSTAGSARSAWPGSRPRARSDCPTPGHEAPMRAGQRHADRDAAQRPGRCRRAERHGHRRHGPRLRHRLPLRHDSAAGVERQLRRRRRRGQRRGRARRRRRCGVPVRLGGHQPRRRPQRHLRGHLRQPGGAGARLGPAR